MDNLLLISVLLGIIGLPIALARQPDTRVGLKNLLFMIAILNIVYLFSLIAIYPLLWGN